MIYVLKIIIKSPKKTPKTIEFRSVSSTSTINSHNKVGPLETHQSDESSKKKSKSNDQDIIRSYSIGVVKEPPPSSRFSPFRFNKSEFIEARVKSTKNDLKTLLYFFSLSSNISPLLHAFVEIIKLFPSLHPQSFLL